MDDDAKKTALRMIPYGIYVMTAKANDGSIAAATVNWVTQTSFNPPLVAIGVKVDSGALNAVNETRGFALNMLGKGQQGQAFAFFKPAEVDGNKVSGEPFEAGAVTGSPILENAQASVECKVVEIVEQGDHYIVIGEVVNAHVAKSPEGRPDEAILEMKELGDNVFYGG
jgi:flavin reductase (DIM6/NTAB) family NADH-FMN oxidoreductase RutF